jgi:hypothetical protein
MWMRGGGTTVENERTFTVQDVVRMGFEAQCVAPDGSRYFWHGRFGVKVGLHSGEATLLTDPAVLPDVTWFATSTGLREIEARKPMRRTPDRREHLAGGGC